MQRIVRGPPSRFPLITSCVAHLGALLLTVRIVPLLVPPKRSPLFDTAISASPSLLTSSKAEWPGTPQDWSR